MKTDFTSSVKPTLSRERPLPAFDRLIRRD
jgi:hypothetical protein